MIWQTDSYISYDNFWSYRQSTEFLYKSQLLLFELEPNFKQDTWSSFENSRSFNIGTNDCRTKSYYISEHHADDSCIYPSPWQIQDSLHPLRTKLTQITLCLLKANWAWTMTKNELTCSKFVFHCNWGFFVWLGLFCFVFSPKHLLEYGKLFLYLTPSPSHWRSPSIQNLPCIYLQITV